MILSEVTVTFAGICMSNTSVKYSSTNNTKMFKELKITNAK